jgi:hypothetical protein
MQPYAAVNVNCIKGGFTKQMLQHTNFFFYTFSTWLVVDTYLMCIILCLSYSSHISAFAKQVPPPVDNFCYLFFKTLNIIHPELASFITGALF